ncbi:hypothetical protein MLP_18760 [Microlunatus phosphovorus NM-1]|uniref:Transposase n=1 Tax=Microlunatus phosphovorus (strain ATCC 700054 / DSM 10555 / JCM 9379 / NBRC 101784 / NCIMB 13414 / VKM Ac-1990 / NM-1) TaxID=1032480 RepID=F5XT18_MICPN|nr:hypothetical protein MLP_18760 [Microlunatus phosphovorus NM-1]
MIPSTSASNKAGRILDGGGWRAHDPGSTKALSANRSKSSIRAKTSGALADCTHQHSAVDGLTPAC